MKRAWLVIIILMLVALISGMLGCSVPAASPPVPLVSPPLSAESPPPALMPSSFNLIFRYGVVPPINELNTFNRTYTKDMVRDLSMTTNLTLSKEELDTIYQKMVEINFFDYPDVPFPESVGLPPIPATGYYFRVQYDSKIKELQWTPKWTDNKEKADKLMGLIKLIKDIIESKEEYKKLPEPTSGYL